MSLRVVNPQAPGQVLWRKLGILLGDLIRVSFMVIVTWATIWLLYFVFPK